MADASVVGVAYYARRGGRWAQCYTLLHPPYTAWHLSYVLIGGSLAPHLDIVRLVGTLAAFFLAVGVAAHALDEVHGRPLRTTFRDGALISAAVVALLGAVGLAGAAMLTLGIIVVPIAVIGVAFVLIYNLELADGRLHTPVGFAVAWGAYPVIVGYFAQTGTIAVPALIAAAAATAVSTAQRSLSEPARLLRRHAHAVDLYLLLDTGESHLAAGDVLRPLERALRALSWGISLIGVAATLGRWH